MGISPVSVELKNNKTGKMQEVQLLASNICRSKEQENLQDPEVQLLVSNICRSIKNKIKTFKIQEVQLLVSNVCRAKE